MTETEEEQERKTRGYWANAYKDKNTKNLPYEPSAVLAGQRNNSVKKPIKLRGILNFNWSD